MGMLGGSCLLVHFKEGGDVETGNSKSNKMNQNFFRQVSETFSFYEYIYISILLSIYTYIEYAHTTIRLPSKGLSLLVYSALRC